MPDLTESNYNAMLSKMFENGRQRELAELDHSVQFEPTRKDEPEFNMEDSIMQCFRRNEPTPRAFINYR